MDGEAPPLSPIWPVPIRHPVILGTKLKKAIRIQLVISSINIIHSSLITQNPSPLIIVKMLQFSEPYSVFRISYIVCRRQGNKGW